MPTASSDFFLELEGFDGESADAKFSKAIDVLAWSWGASNADAKTPQFQNFSFTKYIDRTSPKLMEAVATGQTIPTAKLSVRKSGADQQVYLRFCFTGVQLTSQSSGGSAGEDRLTENVTFSYQTIVQAYSQQKPDGTLSPPIVGSWDLTKNQKGTQTPC